MKQEITWKLVAFVAALLLITLCSVLFNTLREQQNATVRLLAASGGVSPKTASPTVVARRRRTPAKVEEREQRASPVPHDPTKVAAMGVHAFNGYDTSLSWRQVGLGQAIFSGAKLSSRLDPDHDKLTLYSVNAQALEFYDGAPTSRRRTVQTIAAEVRRVPPFDGTYPAFFWREVARRAAIEQQWIIVCLWSDGDNDDRSATSRQIIRAAACKLALNPRVLGVFIIGVKSGNWTALREDFGALGNRLYLMSDANLNDIEPMTRLLQKTQPSSR